MSDEMRPDRPVLTPGLTAEITRRVAEKMVARSDPACECRSIREHDHSFAGSPCRVCGCLIDPDPPCAVDCPGDSVARGERDWFRDKAEMEYQRRVALTVRLAAVTAVIERAEAAPDDGYVRFRALVSDLRHALAVDE